VTSSNFTEWSPSLVIAVVVIVTSLSVVFCCYQQVYDIFNMSSRGDTVQVRGRDGMSTPQNGVTAYSQSHVLSHICQGGFLLRSLRFSSS